MELPSEFYPSSGGRSPACRQVAQVGCDDAAGKSGNHLQGILSTTASYTYRHSAGDMSSRSSRLVTAGGPSPGRGPCSVGPRWRGTRCTARVDRRRPARLRDGVRLSYRTARHDAQTGCRVDFGRHRSRLLLDITCLFFITFEFQWQPARMAQSCRGSVIALLRLPERRHQTGVRSGLQMRAVHEVMHMCRRMLKAAPNCRKH